MTRPVATADSNHARDPEALVDELAIKIQSRILAGDYVRDEWLRQDALATEFGVSRTPVREALRKLEASGSLTLVPHRGARVRWPTPRETREAYQVRAELEGLAAELAAEAIVDRELDRLREAQGVFREAADAFLAKPEAADARERWQTANDLFHSVIHAASRNRRLAKTVAGAPPALPAQPDVGGAAGRFAADVGERLDARGRARGDRVPRRRAGAPADEGARPALG